MLRKARFVLLVPQAFWLCLKYKAQLIFWPVKTLNQAAPDVRTSCGWPATAAISRAVYLCAGFIPGTRCLPQALAARELMHRYGIPCQLQLGVATAGGFRAHAWVIADGKVVHGQTMDTFTPLEAPAARK